MTMAMKKCLVLMTFAASLLLCACGGGGGGGGSGGALGAAATVTPSNLQTGQSAPEIAAQSWVNTTEKPALSDLKGRSAVLMFSRSNCSYCTGSLPRMAELYGQATNTLFMTLTHEDASVSATYLAEHPEIVWPYGSSSDTYTAYGVDGVPHFFLVSSAAVILWEGHTADELGTQLTLYGLR